jgi:flagellar basal-body rod modification protein FlgD
MNIQGINPIITAPLQAQAAKSTASTNGTSGGSTSIGTGGLSATDLEGTFLNLLATELQNQDPTSPVDPTQMVGQLVSLNQLDQLISINQTLSSLGGTPSGTSGTLGITGASGTSGNAHFTLENTSGAPSPGSVPSNTLARHIPSVAALSQLQPAYAAAMGTNALMNLYGSFTAPAQSQQLSTTGGR